MSRPARTRFVSRIVAMALLAGLLAACGYKGPLYLPEPDQKAESGPKPEQKTEAGN